jgi:4-aminobutyrate aminotransferase-like enzyme
VVRYSELLRALLPKHLTHAYFTSGREEIIDKGLRAIRFHRTDADIALGFSHQWFGVNTAAARSLSHEEHQAQPFRFFNWPILPHPSLVGKKDCLTKLNQTLQEIAHEKILALVVELVGERSALSFDEEFLQELDSIRQKTGIPLVFLENASCLSRSGKSLFLSDSLSVKANMVLWYTGGQLGHVFVDDQYFVEKPLTLISTWDGDEISMTRAYHHLLKASTLALTPHIQRFAQDMTSMGAKGIGCWQGIPCSSEQALLQAIKAAKSAGVLLGRGFDNTLMICPKPDFSESEFKLVADVVRDLVKR